MNIAVIIASALLSISMLLAPLLGSTPQQPMWPSFLCSLTIIAAALLLIAGPRTADKPRVSTISTLLLAFLGWAVVSTIVHAAVTKLAFLSDMLTATAAFLAYGCAFFSMRRLALTLPKAAYAACLAAVAGGTIMAVIGAREYLINVVAGNPAWRVFATAENPDFLAGYLVALAPIAVAAAIVVPGSTLVRALLAIAAMIEVLTILPTGSRFALISLAISIVLFVAAAARASSGKRLAISKGAMAGIVVVLLAGAVVAKPVISRLTRGQNGNSGLFRVYTWRGTLHMAKSNPVFGTGAGTFADVYPKYALAGFTRHAHDVYLQVAAEMGIPSALLLAAFVLMAIAALFKYTMGTGSTESESSGDALPVHSRRIVAAALLASIAGEAVQNLIDSDLYVFSIGLTFFAFAGLASALAEQAVVKEAAEQPSTRSRPLEIVAALVLAAAAVFCFLNGLAVRDEANAHAALADPDSSAADAVADYRAAESLAPLNGKYPAELGFRVYVQQGNTGDGIAEIKRGIERQPDSLNYLRLGSALRKTGDMAGAEAAYRQGLSVDPNRLELLLAMAQISSPADALGYYRRIAEIERSPIGQVRAIGEVTEQRYALGDNAVADDALAHGDKLTAGRYYRRAVKLLERYADEGGSSFPERAAEFGGVGSPADDQQYATLFDHAASNYAPLLGANNAAAFDAEKQFYDAEFQVDLGDAYAQTGHASDAKTAYQNAQSMLGSCAYPRAAALGKSIDAKIQALSQPAGE